MLVAICSDVHANAAALEAVIANAGTQTQNGMDAVWFLGDAIGYGPSPGLCMNLLRSFVSPGCWIMGNHDALALDLFHGTRYLRDIDREPEAFTADARAVIEALPRLCAADQAAGGDSLEQTLATLDQARLQAAPTPQCLLVHGSVRDPLLRYGTGTRDCNAFAASDELAYPSTRDCQCLLMGHSHFPCLFFDAPDQEVRAQPQVIRSARWMALPKQQRVLINPGSVGQPRDENPQASYVLLDLDRWRVKFVRVAYAAAETGRLIKERGLPPTLAARLQRGE